MAKSNTNAIAAESDPIIDVFPQEAGKELADQIKKIIASELKTVKEKLDSIPDIPKDTTGIGHILTNGKWEETFPANSAPLYQDIVTAATLQLLGTMRMPKGLTQEQREQVLANIPEDILEDLKSNPDTMELAPPKNMSSEAQIAEAIKAYRARKADEMMKQEAEAMEKAKELEGSEKDVEPKNEQKS